MYSLVEYYEEDDIVKTHLVTYCKTKEELDELKIRISKEFKEVGIEVYEVLSSKNIQSLKEILKKEDIKVFQTIKEKMKDDI